MNSPNFNYLGRGLAAANLRQEVISNNIANVNTPNFKKSDVVFEELLAKEIGMDDSGRLPLVRTHDRHLPVGMIGGAKASIQEDDTTTMRVDNNNVDIDIEMASLAKNQLYYNAMATELGGYVNKLKNVITSGQS
nr:flagellar basal body rod protein FlgB [Selenomonas bovis]